MDETRPCPYCGEQIRREATLCRYCRSRVTGLDPERWHRDHPERKLAGVTVAVARALAVPVGTVRLGFIVLAFFHLLGPLLYVAFWLIVPFAPGEDSILVRGLARVREVVAAFRGGGSGAGRTPGDESRPGGGPHAVRVSEGPLP